MKADDTAVDISPSSLDSSLWFIQFSISHDTLCIYELNKYGDNTQPPCTPFSILNQSIVPCLVLTVACWLAYKFFRRQVKRSGTPISKNFPQFIVIHTVKRFSVVNGTEVDLSLEFPCYLHNPANASNLTSGSSTFSISSLYIWKFTYCWSLAWRILSITLIVGKISTIIW